MCHKNQREADQPVPAKELVLHIFPVELSKPKNEADFEHVCVQMIGVAFPKAPRPGETDLDCPTDDVALMPKFQAYLAGYALLRWSVGCSTNSSLRVPEYRLWMRDPLAIYGVERGSLASGYVTSRNAG